MINPVRRSSGNGQSADARMIMLIRHAEKPLHPCGSPHGVNPHGEHDPHSLTVTGWIRAGSLVELFAPSRGEPPAELRRPDTIYASGDEAHLAREIGSRPGATLIAWHHEALHKIAHHLGEVNPTPPRHWPPDRFDLIWTFTPDDHGWRFAQVPQLLLPGDLPYPVAACQTLPRPDDGDIG
jgi:hypothetical protein